MAVHSVPNHGLNGEILRVVLDSPKTYRGLFVCGLVC